MADVERIQLALVRVVGRGAQEAGGDEAIDDLGGERGGVAPGDQFITRELLGEEALPGAILVEGAHDPVAVTPLAAIAELDDPRVVVGADDIDVSRTVEPVPAPAFPQVRRRQ